MHRAVAKKILAQEMGQKKFWQAKNPPPPRHHFSNGPSLRKKYEQKKHCRKAKVLDRFL